MPRSESSAQLVAFGPDQLNRIRWLDTWRGLALLQMMMFHTAYDLSWLKWTHWHLNLNPWTSWRQLIVCQFCLIAGIALAQRPTVFKLDNPWPPGFARRIAAIAAAALAVSVISWMSFGTRWIQFGILHFFAVALLITMTLERWRIRKIPKFTAAYCWLSAGLIALTLGITLRHPYFNASPNYWLGFVTVKPPTEDYVPLFPWIGVLWIGYGLARSQLLKQKLHPDSSVGATALASSKPTSRGLKWVAWLGRHSLSIYLLHQPVILLLLLGLTWCCRV